MNLQPVILAGGSGSRLWPMSREHYPKQLLSLAGEQTLLQDTATRLDGLPLPGAGTASNNPIERVQPPLVICNEELRFLVAEQLRQIDRQPTRLLLEPVGRNTAPALTLAALAMRASGDDPGLLVMPADHVIKNAEAFHAAVVQAAVLAAEGMLVTFGITPDRPETGYGYIKTGAPVAGEPAAAYQIAAFVEKPDAATAQAYLDSGEYLWNSGLFMMKASVWLEAIGRFQPEMAKACRQTYEKGRGDGAFFHLSPPEMEACPSDSIDYAVMEKISGEAETAASGFRAAVVPLDAAWSDVGAWSSLWDISASDENKNVITGDVYCHDTHNSLLVAEHRLVAAVGLDDVVVIETPDAVLVAKKERAQDIKHIVQQLKQEEREEHRSHRKIYRPWGSYESLDTGNRFEVKRLTLNPRAAISLQLHHNRSEHWIVVSGTAKVTREGKEHLLSENESIYIPIGAQHRLENPGKVPLEIIEVRSGSYLGEDDIVRFEETYDRGDES